jgi:hypothetical protein
MCFLKRRNSGKKVEKGINCHKSLLELWERLLQDIFIAFSMSEVPPIRCIQWASRMAQVVEHLPSKFEALSSNPNTVKKKDASVHILA